MSMFKIDLGAKVKSRITGFTGVVTSRVEYINGCIQYCVQPKVDKEGKQRKHNYIDEEELEILTSKQKMIKKKDDGGPMSNAPEK